MSAPVMHPVYLPITEEQLLRHFATTASGAAASEKHLTYYRSSLSNLEWFERTRDKLLKSERLKATSKGLQLQKDERFWVAAALLVTYYEDDRHTRMARLLRRALGDNPPFEGFSDWESALVGELDLFLEVNVPSPLSYRMWLKDNLDERILVPHILESARESGLSLEGTTKVDAVLIAKETGVAVFFEGKVLSDTSVAIKHDALRNQISRSIDVMLDDHPSLSPSLASRVPDRTCFVLLTPRIFKNHPHSRLYGRLVREYQRTPEALGRDLPHRGSNVDWSAVASRLGWLTFEDCKEVTPSSCAWLGAAP